MIDPLTIKFVGAISGCIGVSIAIYLQTMTKRRCDPKWITAYLVSGLVLLLLNVQAASPGAKVVIGAELAAYAIVIAAELIGFMKILKDMEKEEMFGAVQDQLEGHL